MGRSTLTLDPSVGPFWKRNRLILDLMAGSRMRICKVFKFTPYDIMVRASKPITFSGEKSNSIMFKPYFLKGSKNVPSIADTVVIIKTPFFTYSMAFPKEFSPKWRAA